MQLFRWLRPYGIVNCGRRRSTTTRSIRSSASSLVPAASALFQTGGRFSAGHRVHAHRLRSPDDRRARLHRQPRQHAHDLSSSRGSWRSGGSPSRQPARRVLTDLPRLLRAAAGHRRLCRLRLALSEARVPRRAVGRRAKGTTSRPAGAVPEGELSFPLLTPRAAQGRIISSGDRRCSPARTDRGAAPRDRPIFRASSSAASNVMPSRRTRRIIQNAPTRMAAVQWMNIGRFAASSVIFRNSSTDASVGCWIVHRDVEVLQACRLDGLLFLLRTMLARLPQVQHGLDAVGLQHREVFGPRLPAGAEVGCNLQEVADVGEGGAAGAWARTSVRRAMTMGNSRSFALQISSSDRGGRSDRPRSRLRCR